jgi:BA14K-like protein
MINPVRLGAVAATALIVMGFPVSGFAQHRIDERAGEHERANVPPHPPMRAFQPRTVAAPATPGSRNVTSTPPVAGNRFRDHDRDDRGDRGAFAAGVAAGVVLGGALATPGPGIYVVPVPSPADDPIAYCSQTYSSYDPQSGTYIGDDGNPHPCPP